MPDLLDIAHACLAEGLSAEERDRLDALLIEPLGGNDKSAALEAWKAEHGWK